MIASGTPASLKARLGGSQIDVVVRDPVCLGDASHVVERVCGTVVAVDADRRLSPARRGDPVATLAEVLTGSPPWASRPRTSHCGGRRWTRSSWR